jgi:hypothetical protein
MKHMKKTRSTLFFLFSTSILLLACFSTLLWQHQQQHSTQAQAADLSFAVAPTLPAATVDTILANMGSPMAGVGNVIEQASQNYQIDDAFALAVWNVETSEGAAGVGRSYLNPGGVRASPAYSSGLGGYTLYPSYAEGVQDWFRIVRDRYVDRGLSSVYTLCVPYVGTSHAYEWAAKVSNLMLSFRNEAPPAPTPTPTPLIYDKQLAIADAKMLQVSKIVTAPEPQKNTAITHPQPQQTSSISAHQPLAFALILLAALAIALSALFFGKKERTILVQEPEKRYEPITPLPFGNPYLQLFELDTAPQLPAFMPVNLSNHLQPLHLPGLAHPVRSTQELNASSQPQHVGLLKRYATTESLAEAQEPEVVPVRITEDLAYRQMLEVSRRGRTLAGAGIHSTAFRRPLTGDLAYHQMLEGAQEKKEAPHITEDLAYRQMLEVSERERIFVGAGTPPGAFRRPRRLVPLTPDSN